MGRSPADQTTPPQQLAADGLVRFGPGIVFAAAAIVILVVAAVVVLAG